MTKEPDIYAVVAARHREQYMTYVELGLVLGELFAQLDRYVSDDDFYDSLPLTGVRKLTSNHFGHHYKSFGELISESLEDVVCKSHLTDSERDALVAYVTKLGFHFSTDVSAWREYRASKPEKFRLLIIDDLHIGPEIRAYFQAHLSPHAKGPIPQ